MRLSVFRFLCCLLSFPTISNGAIPRHFWLSPPPLPVRLMLSEHAGNGTFEQYVNHSNHSAGTFVQRYSWNSTFWGGPGYPVVLCAPSEGPMEDHSGYLTERAITGLEARAIKGAVVMIEHRYFGNSSPFEVQDTEALQHLSLENSVADLVHFARTVKLPFDRNSSSNAPQAPWVLVGGSYAGALTAWAAQLSPGTFWAYHASSAPVQAIFDFHSYYDPIKEGMPTNCSKAFTQIAQEVDQTLQHGSGEEITTLKEKFGLEALAHDDDFASAVFSPLYLWQYTNFDDSDYGAFYQMCDAIQAVNSTGNSTSSFSTTTKPDAAMNKLAQWFIDAYLPDYCREYGYTDWNDSMSLGCFDSYNESSPMFSDWSSNNPFRPWSWFLCNEPFAYWPTAAPNGEPTTVSRFVTAEYYQRQCGLFFPPKGEYTFASAKGKTVEDVNVRTKGWLLTNTTRLLWANGEFDPWRSASVSSEIRPGGPLESRQQAPVFLMENATHCQDLAARNGAANEGVKAVQDAQVAQIKMWVDEFYKERRLPSSRIPRRLP